MASVHSPQAETSLNDFESHLTSLDDADPNADRAFVVGDMGSLAERIGYDAAQQRTENSLTSKARLGAARRLGKRAVLRG